MPKVVLLALAGICAMPASALGDSDRSGTAKSSKPALRLLDLEKYPMARCLDGSPGGFHFWPSTASEGQPSRNKWVVWHTGGGWCNLDVPMSSEVTTDNCFHRKTGVLGSSKNYPTDPAAGWTVWGMEEALLADPSMGMMHDWNKVVLIYCDGGSFSGRREEPYENSSTSEAAVGKNQLYFRGSYILEGIIDTLLSAEYGMSSVSELVVSGSSAGGLATILHADKWRKSVENLHSSESVEGPGPFVVALPESGFFLDWDNFQNPKPANATLAYNYQMRRDYSAFNMSASSVNSRCALAREKLLGDVSDCFLAEHTIPFVETPMFLLQSTVDAWQLENVLGETKDTGIVNKFREVTTSKLFNALAGARGSGQRLGAFVDSCVHHGGGWKELAIDGVRKMDAFEQWYSAEKQFFSETGAEKQFSKAPSVRGEQTIDMVWWQAHLFPCKECCGAMEVRMPKMIPPMSMSYAPRDFASDSVRQSASGKSTSPHEIYI